jgi:hypothetical protein
MFKNIQRVMAEHEHTTWFEIDVTANTWKLLVGVDRVSSQQLWNHEQLHTGGCGYKKKKLFLEIRCFLNFIILYFLSISMKIIKFVLSVK